MHANLDALLTAIYVLIDDFLPERTGPGRPPRISDVELITLAIAQVMLGLPNDRQFLALARWRLSHLFPYLPKQPGYNKRLRRLGPRIARAINYLAYISPSFCDGLRLLDSTPVPCGRSRETVRRSEFAAVAAYGYCRSHSAYFWAFGSTFAAPRTAPRSPSSSLPPTPPSARSREMLGRVSLEGYTLIVDKGFAGAEFEGLMRERGCRFLRPDRKDEPARFGSLGRVRQWIESVFWTCKGQLGLERHGARTLPGLCARVAIRLLALAAGLWHNWQVGEPGRHFTAYAH